MEKTTKAPVHKECPVRWTTYTLTEKRFYPQNFIQKILIKKYPLKQLKTPLFYPQKPPIFTPKNSLVFTKNSPHSLPPAKPRSLPTFPHLFPHPHILIAKPKAKPTYLFVTHCVTFSKVPSPAPQQFPRHFPTYLINYGPKPQNAPIPTPHPNFPKQIPTFIY